MGALVPRIDHSLRDKARQPRREPTEAEKRLWSILRDRQLDGAHFRRQHPIPPYVADFACVDARLVVEVDSGQHADRAATPTATPTLQRHGWRVLRFAINELMSDLDGVARQITEASCRRVAGAEPRPAAEQALAPPRHRHRPPTAPPPPPSPLPTTTATAAACASPPTPAGPSSSTSPRPASCATATSSPSTTAASSWSAPRPKPCSTSRAADALALARIAWHLGNRHTPTQILPGALRIRADHVLEHLLTDHLGATVTRATAPFDPEGGAYGHGHEH